MKMIVAIIRPEKVEAVQTALGKVEVYLMTASDVRGFVLPLEECYRIRTKDSGTAAIGP